MQHASKTVTGQVDAAGVRPQPHGVNHSSIQATNLLAWWPLYITSPTANAVDLVAGLTGTPSNVEVATDAVFGPVFQGDGMARKYTVPYPKILDFGGTHGSDPAFPFTATVWVKVTIPASSLPTFNNPPNMYVYTFDNPNSAYPGHSIACTRNFPDNGQSIITEWAVDSNAAQVSNYGNKAINDGKWHLLECYFACPPGANQNTGGIKGYIYVDGVLDTVSNGSLQDLFYNGVGSPGTSQPLYIGTDDDGRTSCLNALATDLRFYKDGLTAAQRADMQANANPWGMYA